MHSFNCTWTIDIRWILIYVSSIKIKSTLARLSDLRASSSLHARSEILIDLWKLMRLYHAKRLKVMYCRQRDLRQIRRSSRCLGILMKRLAAFVFFVLYSSLLWEDNRCFCWGVYFLSLSLLRPFTRNNKWVFKQTRLQIDLGEKKDKRWKSSLRHVIFSLFKLIDEAVKDQTLFFYFNVFHPHIDLQIWNRNHS